MSEPQGKTNTDGGQSELTAVVRPYFISCSLESFRYGRDSMVVNKPVNLSLCKNITKSRFKWYPDNTGKPSIVFHGRDTEWAYTSEEMRDADFDKICRNEA